MNSPVCDQGICAVYFPPESEDRSLYIECLSVLYGDYRFLSVRSQHCARMNYFYQFNMCNLVLRKSAASHFSKGEGMSQIKL